MTEIHATLHHVVSMPYAVNTTAWAYAAVYQIILAIRMRVAAQNAWLTPTVTDLRHVSATSAWTLAQESAVFVPNAACIITWLCATVWKDTKGILLQLATRCL